MYQYNQSTRKNLRKKLRSEAPNAEQRLWEFLRMKQLSGLKFRRQYGIGPFVLDFYCPELRLAIEADGDSHYESEEAELYDKRRQEYIEKLDIRFLRFTNDEIYGSLEEVIQIISNTAKKLQD